MENLLPNALYDSPDSVSAESAPGAAPSQTEVLVAFYAGGTNPAPLSGDIALLLARASLLDLLSLVEQHRATLLDAGEIRLYRDWIRANLGTNQPLFPIWFNLGVALSRQGDRVSAIAAYRAALEAKPDFHQAALNLGLALEALGQPDGALQAWTAAIQSDEARTALLNQKSRMLEDLRRLDEAEATLRASLLTDSSQPAALQHWTHIRQKMCQWPILEAKLPGLSPAEILRNAGPLGILALTDDVALQRDVTESWIARSMPPAPARLSPPGGYRHERIRIGYLSSDFCRHAMSYLIAELFERHDRSRFEVYGYCSTIEDNSDIRRRVTSSFDHFRPVRELSDEAAARLIRDDEIDFLVDLNGLTARTRLPVLRWKPAPVQATYLGFIGPVPIPELDYLLCDEFVIPPHLASLYHPAPLSIGRTFQANDSKRAIGEPLSRRELGLPEDKFVLCCFSNHYKITEAVFGAWMAILRRAEHAVLWLAADNQWSRDNLLRHAAQAGVAPDRIFFAERTSPERYMQQFRLADLFLDTFPYNSGTVASDAIRMELPLLTLSGRSFASRMAGSLLTAIGATAGIATDLDGYVDAGVRLATDAAAYADYKRRFTDAAWARTAGDIAQFTADFEAVIAKVVAAQRSA